MVSYLNKNQVVSSVARRDFSNSGLILALSSILLLMACGFVYLLVNFHEVEAESVTAVSASAERYSLLLSSYQQALDAYDTANRAASNPVSARSLEPEFIGKTKRLQTTKERYLLLLDSSAHPPADLAASSDRYFGLVDSLIGSVSNLFGSGTSMRPALVRPGRDQRLLKADVNEYFLQLRLALEDLTTRETTLGSETIVSVRDRTRKTALGWLIVSGFLFAFAIMLAFVLVTKERRAFALTQQFKTVLDHYVNPVAVTDPLGRILYVNAELEKWSGTSRERLLDSNLFAEMLVRDGLTGSPLQWSDILKSMEGGKSWSGEADVRLHPGKVSASTLVVLPITGEGGAIEELMCILHDTAERKILEQQIEETKIQYRNLVNNSLDGIMVIQGGRLVFANPAAARILRYESADEMKDLHFVDTVAPASRPFLVLDYDLRPVGEEVLKNYEMKGLTKDGKLIDLEINARVVVWNEKPALHTSFRDISERKAMERQQAIWLWEQETLSGIDRQLLGIVDLQRVLDIILQQVILLTRAQFAGIALFERDTSQAHWRATRGNHTQVAGEIFRMTPSVSELFRRKDYTVLEGCDEPSSVRLSDVAALDAEKIVSAGFFPLTVNHELRGRLVLGFRQTHRFPEREIRVITSMAEKASIALTSGELYENLLHREKELEFLSGARVQAQEEERRRISREIHDGLGQLLTAIKLNLEILEDSLPPREEASRRIDEAKQLVDNVLKEAREISFNLMPSVLDDFGLGPGLQSLCEQFSRRTGLKVSFREYGLTERLSPDAEIGLYRIVQEALNNIAKHAEAREVEVQLVRHQNKLQMTIEDDGKGILSGVSPQPPTGRGGTGLVGMRERAMSLGGACLIDSSPGKGTTINVEVPIRT